MIAHRDAAVETALGEYGRGGANPQRRTEYPQKYLFLHDFQPHYPPAIHYGCTGCPQIDLTPKPPSKSIPACLQTHLAEDECCNGVRVPQGQDRERSRQRPVGRHRDDFRVARV